MNLKLLYFAAVRDALGRAEDELQFDAPLSVAALLDLLQKKHPPLVKLRRQLRVAVNQEFVEEQTMISVDAEVALIPPVAGG